MAGERRRLEVGRPPGACVAAACARRPEGEQQVASTHRIARPGRRPACRAPVGSARPPRRRRSGPSPVGRPASSTRSPGRRRVPVRSPTGSGGRARRGADRGRRGEPARGRVPTRQCNSARRLGSSSRYSASRTRMCSNANELGDGCRSTRIVPRSTASSRRSRSASWVRSTTMPSTGRVNVRPITAATRSSDRDSSSRYVSRDRVASRMLGGKRQGGDATRLPRDHPSPGSAAPRRRAGG